MVDVTPEQRAEWRRECEVFGGRPGTSECLDLLDALDQADQRIADLEAQLRAAGVALPS
jgi:hypothetical protein